MSLKPERLLVITALRLLRSPRIHIVTLGGALFLTRFSSINENTWLFPAIFSGLAAAIALYTVAMRSKGFLDYASSSLSCPLVVTLLAMGAGATAVVTSIPVSVILNLVPSPTIVGAAFLLGTTYSLVVLPLGTSLPIFIALYIAVRLGSDPIITILVSIMFGLALAPLTCLTELGGLNARRLLWNNART